MSEHILRREPFLLRDLRCGLTCLYSLHDGTPTATDQRKAHDLLLSIQSRNVRRKTQSQRQRQNDQDKLTSSEQSPEQRKMHLAKDEYGSSWLAFLALLCYSEVHPTEQLFAAQSVMHRLRRMKLPEAVDIEIETNPGDGFTTSTLEEYGNWMVSFHPLLAEHWRKSCARNVD